MEGLGRIEGEREGREEGRERSVGEGKKGIGHPSSGDRFAPLIYSTHTRYAKDSL